MEAASIGGLQLSVRARMASIEEKLYETSP
jgi:hypothetical protein